jgi:hypothetical protein
MAQALQTPMVRSWLKRRHRSVRVPVLSSVQALARDELFFPRNAWACAGNDKTTVAIVTYCAHLCEKTTLRDNDGR